MNKRYPCLISELRPNQTFYWDAKMGFYGIFLSKVNNKNRGFDMVNIINSGADGNSEHYETREDCIVWVEKEENNGKN